LCGFGDDLVLRDEIGERRTPIVAFRKLTPDELRQLLPGNKPPAAKPAS
jgi:hypothetical protein